MKLFYTLLLIGLSVNTLFAQEIAEKDTAAENLSIQILEYITTGNEEILNLFVTVGELNRFIDLLNMSEGKKEEEKKSILGNYTMNYEKYQRDCDNLIYYYGPNPGYKYKYSYVRTDIDYDLLEYGNNNNAVIIVNFTQTLNKSSVDLFVELFVIRTKSGWKIYTIGEYQT